MNVTVATCAKFHLRLPEYFMNKSITKFHGILNSLKILLVGQAPKLPAIAVQFFSTKRNFKQLHHPFSGKLQKMYKCFYAWKMIIRRESHPKPLNPQNRIDYKFLSMFCFIMATGRGLNKPTVSMEIQGCLPQKIPKPCNDMGYEMQ